MLCTGAGTPTVLLEAGASSFAIDWTLVQDRVAGFIRVCAYDRAGHGWSDPAPGVLGSTTTDDLKALLTATGTEEPLIFVGASAGGLYVREYQARYPDDVAGLVLVDPASEDRLFTILDGRPVQIASLSPDQVRRTVPQGPITVPERPPQRGEPFDGLPPDLYERRVALEERLIASLSGVVPHEIVLESAEADRVRLGGLLKGRTRNPLGDLPLIVLTRGVDSSADLVASHRELASLSTNSRHIVVEGAGHEIHLYQPQAVVDAIREVVEAVRGDGMLRSTSRP
jgi:pimeloyl-ACP methyl ester carboxylesterase